MPPLVLVVRHPVTLEPTPYYFKGVGSTLWYNNSNLHYGAPVGCPEKTPLGRCYLDLSLLGATEVDWQPYIFLQDNHGKVWVAQRSSKDSKTWTWKNVGCPFTDSNGNCEMLKWLGATSVRDGLNEPQRPYLFVTKDKVYNLWRDKNEVWHWSDMGCPAGKGKCGKEKLEGLGATRTIDDSSPSERPYLFAIDHNTSKVWSLWWDAMHMTWHWSDLGCPAGECGKKYNGLGDMMTNAMVRTTIDDDGFDIGNTRHPYVFVVEADDPEKVHYLRLLDKKQDKQIGTWKEARRKDRKRIIGVVSVLIHNGIIPVIVSEKKDSRISLEYLAPNDPDKWHGRDYDCSSCALHSAIPISGTHIPNGSGVIMYGYFGGLKEGGYFGEEFLPEFKTYSF